MNIQLIPNQSVASLRNAGYKVKVMHERWAMYENSDGRDDEILLMPEYEIRHFGIVFMPKGGKTTVIVKMYGSLAMKEKQYRGVALCSDLDSFNRKLGVKIALGRLQEIDCATGNVKA